MRGFNSLVVIAIFTQKMFNKYIDDIKIMVLEDSLSFLVAIFNGFKYFSRIIKKLNKQYIIRLNMAYIMSKGIMSNIPIVIKDMK